MSLPYTTYCVHTDHSIDSRSWIISTTPPPAHHEQDILWSSKRSLDDTTHEVVERVSRRHGLASDYCEIHTPVKGWYLLITSPSKAFGAAQKQASLHSDPSSSKSYINLLPSRTSTHSGTSTEFKFHLSHSPSLSTVNPSKEHNKRKSHTIVETDNNPTTSNTASSANKGWTTFSDNTSITDKPSSNPFQEASQSSSTATSLPTRLKTSTFLLRPINHSIAKSHLANTKQHDHAHAHTKENRRISLRGIAGLFSATDNSFELIWQNEEEGIEIPILIFEDHPSIIRTETRGQFHLFESLIREEFQVPLNEQQQQVQEFQSQNNNEREIEFDLMTFFITVGIAYLGFLEDQEAYKAASQG